MEFYLVLTLLFLGITALIWTIVTLGVQGLEQYRKVFTEQTDSKLRSLFLFFDAKILFTLNVLAILLVPLIIYFLFRSLFFVVLALIVFTVLPRLILNRMENKRREKINHALPEALSQISGAMRAGSTFLGAMETMVAETKGPISQEFSLVLREQRLGATITDALGNLGDRVQSQEMDLVIAAAQISNDVGGNLSEVFERLSDTLRKKMEMEGKIKALTSQGVLQGWVVGLLPFAIIGALYLVDPENISPIFTNILGWGFLAVILINEVLGGILIRKIVSIDV